MPVGEGIVITQSLSGRGILRAVSYQLRVRVASCECDLRVESYELELRVASCELTCASFE